MREIKFKGWNIPSKTMVDLHAITPLALSSTLFQDGVFLPFMENIILLQYTGLKDKNGKEIYEGDVLTIDGKEHSEVMFGVGTYDAGCYEFQGFYLRSIKYNEQNENTWWMSKNQIERREVIGNIYENQELLA